MLQFSISQLFGTYYILRESLEQGDNEFEVRFSQKTLLSRYPRNGHLGNSLYLVLGQISRWLFRSIS